MLKFVFNFRTRGVRLFCVAGPTRPKDTWLLHVYYMPVKKKICGGLMVIFICMDISVIFLSSIALELGHKRLALDWNLQHGI